MAFKIPSDLNPALVPMAWMLGVWQGNGKGQWPGLGEFDYGIQIDFTENGGSFVHYFMQRYLVDEAGQPTKPLDMETGFWRPSADGNVELVLSRPEGTTEIWAGKFDGAKVELTTDIVASTTTADPQVRGGQRLYGQVEGDLLWTYDRSTADIALQPYLWGRLKRISA